MEVLALDCGAGDQKDRFEEVIRELGAPIVSQLLEVLAQGAPDYVREQVRQSASSQYDQRQAWLAEQGRELLGDDFDRAMRVDRQSYVAQVLGNTDLRLQS